MIKTIYMQVVQMAVLLIKTTENRIGREKKKTKTTKNTLKKVFILIQSGDLQNLR